MVDDDTVVPTDKLGRYVSERLGRDIADTELLNDGLNLVLALSTPNEEHAYVLRRPNKLRHTGLFNDLKQEYSLLEELRDTTVPTPIPVLFCNDDSILGDRFFVTTYLDGAAIPLGSDLPDRFRHPKARERLARRLIDTLAGIHSLDAETFEDVCDHHTPIDQVERATDRLDVVAQVTGREYTTLRDVADWLREHAPSDSQTTLVHGDFRPGNVLFTGTTKPEIAGVLDWETAMLGDPLTELGYLLLRWREEDDPTPSLDELEARYPYEDTIQRLREANESGLAPFTGKPGSPTRRELVDRYEAATGCAFVSERFYRAHAAFMLATVWADLHRYRIEAGMDSNRAPRIDYMAMIADSVASGEFGL